MDPEFFAKARKMLVSEEGLRHSPYYDQVNKLTIGIGHNLSDVPLSDAAVNLIFQEDLEAALTFAMRLFTPEEFHSWTLSRQLAVINMIFNLGNQGFSRFIQTIIAIKDENWLGASLHALDSDWARQVPERAVRVTKMLHDETFPYA